MQELGSHPSESPADHLPYAESHIVIHRVICSRGVNHHLRHPPSQDFRDVPRLYKNANQTNALQGQDRIERLDWYLADHPAISFAVVHLYDCVAYHERIADDFERQWMPASMDELTTENARPHFSLLRKDAKEAVAYTHQIMASSGLKKSLKILQKLNHDRLTGWDQVQSLQYPYVQLYHSRDLLRADSVDWLPTSLKGHLNALADYLDESLTAEYEEAENDFKKGILCREHWEKLFRPNEMILTKSNDEEMAYMSKTYSVQGDKTLVLHCWSWAYDGKFRKKNVDIEVRWPSHSSRGRAKLSDLDYLPLRLDDSGISKRLSNRGTVFWGCRFRKYVDYETVQEHDDQPTKLRYMVDANTYKLLHPSNAPHEPSEELDSAVMESHETPEAPFLYLLPSTIKGYGFHDKKWSELLVRQITDVQWNRTAFETKLVLDDDKKELIESLVANHSERKPQVKSDFLPGKGEGLLILLHGGPGTGKTLTAETVAELAMKPLYRVTCGDIGTKAEDVERYLESVLFIGSRWNCVVLLDEADVFLEERDKMDLKRNALVSVFLRVLEYYDGILVLTSNRIGTFDEAFKSRVQLSLHYPPLTAANRFKVWENFVTLLEQEEGRFDCADIRSSLSSLAQHKLNGRQIRNTLNTARQLAQFKNQTLGYRHLNQAIRNVLDFENYIKTVHDDESDEERADAAGIRHNKKRKIDKSS